MANQTLQVYEAIRDDIKNGKYSPAESLKEVELANEYNASRNTIKKSLLMLEKEGFVVIEPNKGAKVRAYSLEEVLNFLELRSVLEGFITELTVPMLKKADIAKLESILNQMRTHFENHALIEHSKCNHQFHMILHEACPNTLAVQMSNSLKNQMSKYNTKTILIPGRNEASIAEHSAILKAIQNGEAQLAGSLMKRHILNVRETFKEHYTLLI